MYAANPTPALKNTTRGILTAFASGPRKVLVFAAIWVLMGTSCGLLGLGNTLGFFNVFSYFLFIVAGLLFVLALVKFILWKRNALREILPDGTVLVTIEHMEVEARPASPGSSILKGDGLIVSGNHGVYVLPVAPAATGSEPVTIPCP